MSCEPPTRPADQDEVVNQEDPLLALINQMGLNWDQDDNAANDDLVLQIHERIRLLWATAHSRAAHW